MEYSQALIYERYMRFDELGKYVLWLKDISTWLAQCWVGVVSSLLCLTQSGCLVPHAYHMNKWHANAHNGKIFIQFIMIIDIAVAVQG